MKRLAVVLVAIFATCSYAGQQPRAEEEPAIKNVLTRFYDGWNAHDPEAMVSIYAENIDHINVWGETNRPKIVAITNDAASPLASEADIAAMLMAGPEVAALG
jgi:hypothetical protein